MPIQHEFAEIVPDRLITDELDLAAMRMSKDAPTQYQEYDRNRAEAEFRLGICLPVFLLGVAAALLTPVPMTLAIVAISTALAVMFLVQGLRLHQLADESLASATYFGYATTPLFENLVRSATAAKEDWHSDLNSYTWLMEWVHTRRVLEQYPEMARRVCDRVERIGGTVWIRNALDDLARVNRPAYRAWLVELQKALRSRESEAIEDGIVRAEVERLEDMIDSRLTTHRWVEKTLGQRGS